MKVTTTANLNLLQKWLTGYSTSDALDGCDGFNTFGEYRNELKVNNKYDFELVKRMIEDFITNEENIFNFGSYSLSTLSHYRFKMPCDKNLNILTRRVIKDMEEQDAE